MISKEFFDQKLAEMPKEFLLGAVNYLKDNFSLGVKQSIIDMYKEAGENWWIGHHLFWGIGVRNSLREGGFKDEQLPDQNWDNYYIPVVELAVGIRNINEL